MARCRYCERHRAARLPSGGFYLRRVVERLELRAAFPLTCGIRVDSLAVNTEQVARKGFRTGWEDPGALASEEAVNILTVCLGSLTFNAGEMAEKYATKFGLEIVVRPSGDPRAICWTRRNVGRSRQPVRAEQFAMTDAHDPTERFALPTLYQGGSQRAASVGASVILLFGAMVLVVATFPSGPLWAQLVTGSAGVLLVAVYVCRAIWWMGLRFDEHGIDIVRRASHRRLRYEDVTGFTLGRYYQTRSVFVHTRDGASHVAVGVSVVDRGPFRTNEFRGQNGRSSDVLGRLQRHLEWVRTDGRVASPPSAQAS